MGPITEQTLRGLYFDKAFIGANGCSRVAGISTFDPREAAKKRLTHERSRVSYVLIDHTKFGQSAFSKAIDLEQCNLIVDEYDDLLELAKSYRVAPDSGTGAVSP